jgi:hypothetical protein
MRSSFVLIYVFASHVEGVITCSVSWHVSRRKILIAEAGRQPVRLHPTVPDMLPMASYTPTEPVQKPEPWSERT